MPLTLDQLYTFHGQERHIFATLVIKFGRIPAQSLLVMATWLWLEDIGFDNIFSIILNLPDQLITVLANEAVICYQCLASSSPPNVLHEIPLTTKLMKKPISLRIIYSQRYSGITGIKNFLTTVCSRVFSDILQSVLPSSYSFHRFHHPLLIPGFPHPIFGNINVLPYQGIFPINNLFFFPNDLWGWNSKSSGSDKDRTLFITFSRGFPVSELEVMLLFRMKYGDHCVKGIYMQEGSKNIDEQPLYARLVLDSVATVDRVLRGEGVQKLKFNRKHIWARKYEDRDPTC